MYIKNGKPRIFGFFAAYSAPKILAACHIRLFRRRCFGSLNIALIGIELFGRSAENDIIYLYSGILFYQGAGIETRKIFLKRVIIGGTLVFLEFIVQICIRI